MTTSEEFLEHYGVPGMKWGKRKENRLGFSKDAKRAEAAARKAKSAGSVKVLTNKELQELNKRIDLEVKYNKLNPNKIQKGKQYTKTAMAAAGIGGAISVNSIMNFAKSPTGQAIKNAIEKKKVVDWTNLKL